MVNDLKNIIDTFVSNFNNISEEFANNLEQLIQTSIKEFEKKTPKDEWPKSATFLKVSNNENYQIKNTKYEGKIYSLPEVGKKFDFHYETEDLYFHVI